MRMVRIEYNVVKLLIGSHDIGVYSPRTGEFFNFSDKEWCYRGIKIPYEEVLQKLGTGGMDSEYYFLWVNLGE